MFDIGGYELILLAAVAILVVGPRELPGMLRSVGRFVSQARQMMTGVQRQFNDALKEAELDDVKKTIDDVRSLNPATKIRQTIAKEFKPLSDAGDSVKKAVGEVKIKGPAPAAATAAATPAAADAATTEPASAVASPAAKTAPAKKPAAKKTATNTSAATSSTAAKAPATKAAGTKTPGSKSTSAKKPAVKKTTSKASTAVKPAAKTSASASTGSTLTQSKPRKPAAAAKTSSDMSGSDGG